MAIAWRLREVLEEHGISRYRLAKATGGQLSQNAVYQLTSGNVPARIELRTLEVVVLTLRRLTHEPITIQDLLAISSGEGDHELNKS